MPPPTRDPVRILHLDDSPQDALLIQHTLNTVSDRLPTSVVYVQTREQYRDALERGRFDLILSDYRMPGYDGDDALRDAKRICPETPFIMVTGEMGEERAIETLKCGASDYVLKDKMLRLVPAIERALADAENQRREDRHGEGKAEDAPVEDPVPLQGQLGR